MERDILKTEKIHLSRTKLALNICVFAFLLNYLYSLILALISEPIQGLTSPHSNIAYALAIGFPIFVLCGIVLRPGRRGNSSASAENRDREGACDPKFNVVKPLER